MFQTAPMFGDLTPFGAAMICYGICFAIVAVAYVVYLFTLPRKELYRYEIVPGWEGEEVEKVHDLRDDGRE